MGRYLDKDTFITAEEMRKLSEYRRKEIEEEQLAQELTAFLNQIRTEAYAGNTSTYIDLGANCSTIETFRRKLEMLGYKATVLHKTKIFIEW